MKGLFLFLLGCFPLMAAAFGEKADRIGPYYVYYQPDSTLKADEGKVLFECAFFGAGDDDNFIVSVLMYGIDGSNEQIVLDDGQKALIAAVPGMHTFRFAVGRKYEEIETGEVEVKPGELTVIRLNFFAADHEILLRKPVIYCYPETETEMTLNVTGIWGNSFTYPQLPEDGWKFTAQPDGTLRFGEKTYPYLFWEMELRDSMSLDPAESFCVQGTEITGFLEHQLTALGLTSREQADFITFWAPLMSGHAFLHVQFIVNEDCNSFAKLAVEPAPDHVNRVYMLWQPTYEDVHTELHWPELPAFDRSGFDVLEWGGLQLQSRNP